MVQASQEKQALYRRRAMMKYLGNTR